MREKPRTKTTIDYLIGEIREDVDMDIETINTVVRWAYDELVKEMKDPNKVTFEISGMGTIKVTAGKLLANIQTRLKFLTSAKDAPYKETHLEKIKKHLTRYEKIEKDGGVYKNHQRGFEKLQEDFGGYYDFGEKRVRTT